MSSLATKAALLGALAGSVAAHGTVSGFSIDGVYQGGFLLNYYYMIEQGATPPATAGWYAENLDNGFIDGTGYQTADIICHKNAKPATSTASVAAGGTVDFHWTEWPDSHIGPILTYVAKCSGDCSDADKTALEWVKIDEAAIDLSTQEWPTDAMIANNNTYSVTVPSTLAAGNYVFRHEIIAMHGARDTNGAQNYPQCINIAITGSGSDSPAGTLGTELYTSTDAGIKFDPYATLTEYEIPGPALYSAGSSGGGSDSGSGSSSTAAAPAPTSAAATSAAATSAAATSAPAPAETTAPASSDDDDEDDGEDCTGDDEGADDEDEDEDDGEDCTGNAEDVDDEDEDEDDGEDCTGGDDDDDEPSATVAPTVAPTVTAAPTTLQTSTRAAATTTAAPGGSGIVAVYGQCGGSGFTGSTTCVSGSTCKAQNPYYSQCVPQ